MRDVWERQQRDARRQAVQAARAKLVELDAYLAEARLQRRELPTRIVRKVMPNALVDPRVRYNIDDYDR